MSRVLAAIVLLACVALGGCAKSDNSADNNRFGGFYGGVTGGAAR